MIIRLTATPMEWHLIPHWQRSWTAWNGYFLCFWLSITEMSERTMP